MEKSPAFIIVIGTSAGGINALAELVSQFDDKMDAAFLIVMHLSRKGIGEFLTHRLQLHTSLPCEMGESNVNIEKGKIYIAPPDNHMLVDDQHIFLGKGPAENRWRPSVNNLFRSAAASWGSSVIGIILTGFLDDGSAGMSAIKRSGGMCIVQDPNEAEYPDMPLAVLNSMEVDYCSPLAEIGNNIRQIIEKGVGESDIPSDVLIEASLDLRVSTSIKDLEVFEKSPFNCPDCGGGLWVTSEKEPVHFRCHVGHSFTEKDLHIRLSETIEGTLWTALRMMEERNALLMKLHEKNIKKGLKNVAGLHLQQSRELSGHIQNLKKILFTAPDPAD